CSRCCSDGPNDKGNRADRAPRSPSGVDRDLRRPQRVSAFEGMRVGADARALGQGPELLGVATAQHDILRKERATKQRDDGQNVLSPALFAQTPEPLFPDVVLERAA